MRNRLLWIGQGVLAWAFLFNGAIKIILSPADLAVSGPANLWAADAPPLLVIVVGIIELAGALGVVLPWLTGRQRHLTAWAGGGLALIMLVAAILHVTRAEFSIVPLNVILAAIGVAVFLGRRVKASGTAAG